jgi:hypothetical protein
METIPETIEYTQPYEYSRIQTKISSALAKFRIDMENSTAYCSL